MSVTIRSLPEAQGAALAAVIARAFHNYPPFHDYVHADLDGEAYVDALRSTFQYYIDITYAAGDPVVGAFDNDTLIGGMLFRTPTSTDDADAMQPLYDAYANSVDRARIERLDAFEQAMHDNEPDVDGGRYYIDIIAVEPDIQSRGLGRLMIEHVIELSENDPASVAVCLCTETPENHGLYEHLGFSKVSARVIGPITTTSFLLPTPG